jgi:hypothetical protein
MLERKNIDRVFQENLKDLEIDPGKKVWNNIEISLRNPNNFQIRRKVAPLWYRLSGVAMILILLLTGGIWYNNENADNTIKSEVSGSNNGKLDIENQIPVIQNTNKPVEVLAQNKKIEVIRLEEETPIFVKKANSDVILTFAEFSAESPSVNMENNFDGKLFDENIKKDDGLISIHEAQVKTEIKRETKKWSVGPTIAPIYYNTLQNGSPLNSNLTQNSKSSDNALSVGIKINYQLSKKFYIQSGLNKVELAYNTNDVNATLSSAKNAFNNINTNRSGVILTPVSKINNLDLPEINNVNKSTINGDLNQSIEYFELPVEMKYNLYDKKVGLNLVGGFSTYFLTKNSVSLVSQNSVTDLGQASNLNDFNFSGNFGVDLDYKINKSWYLNIAPMFKYQFNTYSNNSGNFKPYYFGVYSGLNYRF